MHGELFKSRCNSCHAPRSGWSRKAILSGQDVDGRSEHDLRCMNSAPDVESDRGFLFHSFAAAIKVVFVKSSAQKGPEV